CGPWERHFHSDAPVRPSAEAPAVPRRRKTPRLAVQASEFHLHKPDNPVPAFGLGEADEFAAHRLADEDVLALPLDLAPRLHASNLVPRVVPWVLDARRVGPGRGHIVPRRRLLPECLVRPLAIEFPAQPIEALLLGGGRRRRRRRRLLL